MGKSKNTQNIFDNQGDVLYHDHVSKRLEILNTVKRRKLEYFGHTVGHRKHYRNTLIEN